MNILFAASEAVPFAKTGGLADVAGSLPQALARAGHRVCVVLPLYEKTADSWRQQMTLVRSTELSLSWRQLYCGLFRLELDGVTWYFIDNEYYFRRSDLYGYGDDIERFAFFSRAVVSLLPAMGQMPDVIHCNDWQTALVPIYLQAERHARPELCRIKTVFTVHNIEYQGRCGREAVEDIFGLHSGWYTDGTLDMDGDVDLLKGALMVCDAITAVSPSYARELQDPFFAHGLDSVLRRSADKLHGVLNGIDMVRYDPANTPGITPYSADDISGKAANKARLQRRLGLAAEADVPIIAIVSRLVGHKGLDLVCQVFDQIMDCRCQFVVLGSGEAGYEQFFSAKAPQYSGRMALHLGYNEPLATEIYAGADLLLMPSRSEPCGLAQMIAMRYGTLPIVRETGGLRDTVTDLLNGFSFSRYDSSDMLRTVQKAMALYRSAPDRFHAMRKAGMTADFSWNRSAETYSRLYQSICF